MWILPTNSLFCSSINLCACKYVSYVILVSEIVHNNLSGLQSYEVYSNSWLKSDHADLAQIGRDSANMQTSALLLKSKHKK